MKKKRFKKLQYILLATAWLLFQLFYYKHFGIVTGYEATKYIEQAHNFLNTGSYSSANFLFYSIEILLISCCLKWNISFVFIIIFQMLMNALSIASFYQLAKRFSNITIAYFTTLYFLLFFYYHLYNVHLFTESLFFSFSILYTYFLFTRDKLSWMNGLLIFTFLLLLYFTRPTGIFFIPATFLFILFKFYPKKALPVIVSTLIIALLFFSFLLNFSLGSGGEFDFILPYREEIIICGVPTIKNAHQIDIPVEKNSIQGLAYVITHHFPLFFNLSIRRLAAFFGIYRPYYSVFHNLFGQIYFYIIYFIILVNIKKLFNRNKPEIWFMITLISLTTFTVMLTCDEWHNRFILAILPIFLLLAVNSINNFKKKPDKIETLT